MQKIFWKILDYRIMQKVVDYRVYAKDLTPIGWWYARNIHKDFDPKGEFLYNKYIFRLVVTWLMPENSFRTLAHDVFEKSDLEVSGLIYDIFDDVFLIDNVTYLMHTTFLRLNWNI